MIVFSNQCTKTLQKCFVFVCVCSCIPLFSHSFSALSNFTHIYSDSSGTSLFYNIHSEGELSFPHFSAGLTASYGRIYSSLENITAKANAFNAGIFAKTKFVDFYAKSFFLNAKDLVLHINDDYKIERSAVFGMSFLLPIKLSPFTITPIFSFGTMKSENGDMHYFYSEPKIPLFYVAGAQCEVERLKIASLFASSDIDFYANEQNGSEKLIDSTVWAVGILSQYEFTIKNFSIVPSFGFFHLDLKAKGTLTAQNQKYVLFPYKIFTLAGGAKIDALIFGANFTFKRTFFSLFADFTAFLCINQTGFYKANYLYKQNIFFNGSKGSFSGDFTRLKGNGIGFFTIATDFAIPVKNMSIVLSPKKTFLIPLFFNVDGIKKSSGSGSDRPEGTANNGILYYLLSGLSFSATLQYK